MACFYMEGRCQVRQRGFTLIELVMVIVIIGILAAVAVPKFVDLTSEAQTAATQGVAGAIASGSAANYSARLANSSLGVAVTDCSDATGVATIPTGYSITASACTATGGIVSCTVTRTGGGTATADVVCTGTP
jgi:MSHA pilin protein MshA